jgi:predicted Zn-dependent protease
MNYTQKKNTAFTLILSMILLFSSCSTVPITGRKQLHLIPEGEMLSMSLTNYDQFLKEHKLSTDAKNTAMVKRVGENIAAAVTKFMKEKGMEHRIKDFDWEFNLVEENVPNAWCMPGGKVVVYTGLLPLTKTEEGLAVVMGHEIAHAIARHGNERMSQELAVQLGGMALSMALEKKPEETKLLFMQAYGVGTQVGVMLPYSRAHETEADKLGLIFMAMAGYNPEAAIPFWSRMAQSGGQKPPEILSTHPSDETRIRNLKEFMPEALKYYKKQG